MQPLLILLAVTAVVGPGESLAAAVARAGDGDRIVVRGEHHERVRLDRRLELAGEAGATLDGDGKGTVLTVAAPGCVVRDLLVRRSGRSLVHEDSGVLVAGAPGSTVERVAVEDALFGVNVKASPGTRVAGCRVRGLPLPVALRGDGIRVHGSASSRVEGCTVEDVRDVILWFSEGSTFSGNVVRRARYGLHLMNTADARCEGNLVEDASVGIFSMFSSGVVLSRNRIGPVRGPSGYGIGLKETDAFRIEANVIGDARVGAFFDASPLRGERPCSLEGNHFLGCDVGLSFMPSVAGVTIAGNAFVENAVQVEVRGGGSLPGNAFSRDGRGNFWSDDEGFDSGDGTGALPYRPASLYEALAGAHPDLELFAGGLAARALDRGARAVPVFAPAPTIEDAHPLCARPALPEGVPEPRPREPSPRLAALGAALLALGLAFLAGLGRDG